MRHPEARRIQFDRDWKQYVKGDVADISDHRDFAEIVNGNGNHGHQYGHVVDDKTPLTERPESTKTAPRN
jgi:hypothetical protein